MVFEILASFIIVWRNFIWLVFYPYAAVRKIAKEKDIFQVVIIFFLVYLYFVFAQVVRKKTIQPFIISSSSLVSFIFFLLSFCLVISFFCIIGNKINKSSMADFFQPLVFTFSYSLFPTLIWFFITSFLYYVLPPPRTFSFSGRLFSILFISFSSVLFYWKIMLLYLSLRFSLRLSFGKIVYSVFFWSLWFLPYSILMYKLKIFRLPFI